MQDVHTVAGANKLLQVYAETQHGLIQLLVQMLVLTAELVAFVTGMMILAQTLVADFGYQTQRKKAVHVAQTDVQDGTFAMTNIMTNL